MARQPRQRSGTDISFGVIRKIRKQGNMNKENKSDQGSLGSAALLCR